MYREKIKVVDCTIRDGGLINDWHFDTNVVKNVYRALSEAGVDYMEVGYKASKKIYSPSDFGRWRFCDEDDVKEVIDGVEHRNTKLGYMVDVGRVDEEDILPKSQSVFDLVRVATYVKDIDKAIYLANHVTEKGYDAFINIMAVSHALESDLMEALEQVERETNVLGVYLVDSFGAMYCEQIEYLTKKYKSILETKEVGIHAHNNQQLAFSNTIEAIIHGANYLDATIYGIGRAAGNCPLELLISFLKNPKFDLRPILDVISSTFIPLREQMEWGYLIPYMISGVLDRHPKRAMEELHGSGRNDFKKFYEGMLLDPELA